MTAREYLQTCIKFKNDTSAWGGLENKFYTTSQSSHCWDKTTDNEHGGVDVSWAFHKSQVYIESHATEHFLANFQQEMDLLEEAETKEAALRNALIIRSLFSSTKVYDANTAEGEADSIVKEIWE